jgi:ABC-2 type transport system permease protein
MKAVTPEAYHPLLHDLFEANTFWDLKTERATPEPTATGDWQVTLDVRARKSVVDTAGVETELPMYDWVEVGAFAPGDGDAPGAPHYVQMHRIRSGAQTIRVIVPRKPVRAGIDPRDLLSDWEFDDNLKEVKVKS